MLFRCTSFLKLGALSRTGEHRHRLLAISLLEDSDQRSIGSSALKISPNQGPILYKASAGHSNLYKTASDTGDATMDYWRLSRLTS